LDIQDGTFGDSQRQRTRASGTGPSIPQTHPWIRSGIVGSRSRGTASRAWQTLTIRGLVRERRNRRASDRAADPGACRAHARRHRTGGRRAARGDAAELRSTDRREGCHQGRPRLVSARVFAGGGAQARPRCPRSAIPGATP